MYIYLPAYYLFPLAIWPQYDDTVDIAVAKESNRHKDFSFCGNFFDEEVCKLEIGLGWMDFLKGLWINGVKSLCLLLSFYVLIEDCWRIL